MHAGQSVQKRLLSIIRNLYVGGPLLRQMADFQRVGRMKFSVEKLRSELDMKARTISQRKTSAENKDALSAIRLIKYALHGFSSISEGLMQVIDQMLISAGVLINWEEA